LLPSFGKAVRERESFFTILCLLPQQNSDSHKLKTGPIDIVGKMRGWNIQQDVGAVDNVEKVEKLGFLLCCRIEALQRGGSSCGWSGEIPL